MEDLDWQLGLIGIAIVIIGILIIKKIFFNRKDNINKRIRKLMLEGLRYDKIGEYQTAVYFFKQILSLTDDLKILKDVYFVIAGCYMNLRRYENSISFSTKSLKINLEKNLLALRMRIYCNSKIGNYKGYLKDLILYNSFIPNGKNEDKIKELIYKISTEEASIYCNSNVLSFSNLRYSSFFDTLIGILPNYDDEIVYLIKNKQYDRLDDIFFTKEKSILKSIQSFKSISWTKLCSCNFIQTSLYYLKGEYEKAKELLKSANSDFEVLFLEFLNSTSLNYKPNDDVLKRKSILNSNNHSIIFYLAKIYFNRRDYDNYLYQMGKLLDYNFAYVDFLTFFDQNNDNIKFEDFAKEASKKFPGDSKISYVCSMRYYYTNQLESLNNVLQKMCDNDPVKHFILGLIYTNEPIISQKHLKSAIKIDPTYHDAYMLLFNIKKEYDHNKSREIILKSLDIASCYREVFMSMNNLLIIENQKYVLEIKTTSR